MKLLVTFKEISLILLQLLVIIFVQQGCHSNDNNEYYTLDDFSKVKKIDVHAHQLNTRTGFIEQAVASR